VEAALPFIGIDSFLRDPKGLTCITLHSFTDFFEVFTSDTVTDGPCRCPGFRKPVPGREPAKSGTRENHHSPFLEKRQVACPGITATETSRSGTSGQWRNNKKAGIDRIARLPDRNFPCPLFRCVLILDGMSTTSISKHSNRVKKLTMLTSRAASVCVST
jgi:hypothetical protein